MFFLAARGFRCIAHDRRGHGRSSQPWDGNDMDTYADDLAELVSHLGLQNAIHVGHSTGGGEVARYIGRHGCDRVAKARCSIRFVPPFRLTGHSYWRDLSGPFYGANREGAKVSQGLRVRSGCRARWRGSKPATTASKRSRRPIYGRPQEDGHPDAFYPG
jgi:non-heme chloroperoxidase